MTLASAGGRIAWVAPFYKNTRPFWRFAESATAQARRAGLVRTNRSERLIEFPSGGFVAVYTADNATGILGEAFNLAICDEAARLSDEVWEDTLFPTLADAGGDAIFISTPKGHNWFHGVFDRGVRGVHGYASWHAPSWQNPNPRIREAADRARAMLSDRTFRQEWGAEFVGGGEVFRTVDECKSQLGLQGGNQLVFGVDWARQQDWTVVVGYDTERAEAAVVYRTQRVDYDIQQQAILAKILEMQPSRVVVETNAMGRPEYERLRRAVRQHAPFCTVIGQETTHANKDRMIEDLVSAFERRALTVDDDAVMIGELKGYECTRLPGGDWRYSHGPGGHDDTVMALALAYSARRSTRRARITGFAA
jgi:hypothetical protein